MGEDRHVGSGPFSPAKRLQTALSPTGLLCSRLGGRPGGRLGGRLGQVPAPHSEESEASESEPEPDTSKPTPEKTAAADQATEKATEPAKVALADRLGPRVAPKRCREWPHCTQGVSCPFEHPALPPRTGPSGRPPCTMFPHCKFGSACSFSHPRWVMWRALGSGGEAWLTRVPGGCRVPCKYDPHCTNAACNYTHRPKAASKVAQVPCRFAPHCKNKACPFFHPKCVQTCVPARKGEGLLCKGMACVFGVC